MDNIRITENHEEMKAIAREIIEEKKAYYSDRVMDMIRDFITGRLPDIRIWL